MCRRHSCQAQWFYTVLRYGRCDCLVGVLDVVHPPPSWLLRLLMLAFVYAGRLSNNRNSGGLTMAPLQDGVVSKIQEIDFEMIE